MKTITPILMLLVSGCAQGTELSDNSDMTAEIGVDSEALVGPEQGVQDFARWLLPYIRPSATLARLLSGEVKLADVESQVKADAARLACAVANHSKVSAKLAAIDAAYDIELAAVRVVLAAAEPEPQPSVAPKLVAGDPQPQPSSVPSYPWALGFSPAFSCGYAPPPRPFINGGGGRPPIDYFRFKNDALYLELNNLRLDPIELKAIKVRLDDKLKIAANLFPN